jgi:predicted transcriptional regulator of viral defense system
MVMKNTILSKSDAELLEDVIAKYGQIVDIDDLYKAFEKHYNTQETRKRVSLLSQKGWLQRIKKGIYAVVTDIGELNALNQEPHKEMEFVKFYPLEIFADTEKLIQQLDSDLKFMSSLT